MSRAFIFPGQGSQVVGMGRALAERYPAARAVFEAVDEALGERLSALMFEGPAETLTLTANAQPALLAASLAVLRVLEAEAGLDLGRDAAFVAGHSLGEYAALAAAGALDLADAARLLRVRGEAMQRAVPPGAGAMAALLGLDLEPAREIAREAAGREVCDVANDNGAGQVVVSGDRAAVERAVALAAARGARRAVMLPVSAPFHCALMAPATEAMRAALAEARIAAPAVPVVANVAAAPLSDPEAIRDALVRQVTGTVRWRESVAMMAGAGVDRFHELGAGAGADRPRPADRPVRGGERHRHPRGRRRLRLTVRPPRPVPRSARAMFDLTGRNALVTGATGGIGGAIARALHARGASVAVSGTRRPALDALAAELGERVHPLEADLADRASVEALVPAAEAALGGLDILVNNAGITRDNLFLRMKDEEWDAVIAVNLTAAFRLSRAAVKGMMRRRHGRIVAIGSVVGTGGNPGQGNYAAAKAGLVGMTKALAAEVASRGITVNCVAPGFIASPMTDGLDEKQRTAILEGVPMRRLGEAAEVAGAVVYLASSEAAYVTGATLHVNGGMAMV